MLWSYQKLFIFYLANLLVHCRSYSVHPILLCVHCANKFIETSKYTVLFFPITDRAKNNNWLQIGWWRWWTDNTRMSFGSTEGVRILVFSLLLLSLHKSEQIWNYHDDLDVSNELSVPHLLSITIHNLNSTECIIEDLPMAVHSKHTVERTKESKFCLNNLCPIWILPIKAFAGKQCNHNFRGYSVETNLKLEFPST